MIRRTPIWVTLPALAAVAACGSDGGLAPELEQALVAVTGGLLHTCGLDGDGTAYCWGWNEKGQLGNGSNVDTSVPLRVSTSERFVEIAAGGGHTCAITTGGETYCWGQNLSGELGTGSNQDANEPARVTGGVEFVSLVLAGTSTCGLALDGSAYCWGWNQFGQLGDGTNTDANAPVAVAGGLTFSSLAVGTAHVCGITVAGPSYCWGRNTLGELGDGTEVARNTPVMVGGGLTFTMIAAGEGHTCGLVAGGEVFCWGQNDQGQSATPGGGVPNTSPTAIIGDFQFTSVYANTQFSCGKEVSGVIYCWGANDAGQHGSLSGEICQIVDITGLVTQQFPCSSEPFPMNTSIGFESVSLGTRHACGITSGSPLAYCWGAGLRGALGDGLDGTLHARLEPQLVRGQPSP